MNAAAHGQRERDAVLDTLREAGAPQIDPVGWAWVSALSRRAGQHPGPVGQRLQARLDQASQALAERLRSPRRVADPGRRSVSDSPLARLNTELRQREAALHGADDAMATTPEPAHLPGRQPDLRSASRFAELWQQIAAESQVEQAQGRAPEQAGPLNSHALVLRTLALMRELSPDYLRRFVAQVDTLLWLEQASQRRVAGAPRAAKRPRSRR